MLAHYATQGPMRQGVGPNSTQRIKQDMPMKISNTVKIHEVGGTTENREWVDSVTHNSRHQSLSLANSNCSTFLAFFAGFAREAPFRRGWAGMTDPSTEASA